MKRPERLYRRSDGGLLVEEDNDQNTHSVGPSRTGTKAASMRGESPHRRGYGAGPAARPEWKYTSARSPDLANAYQFSTSKGGSGIVRGGLISVSSLLL